MAKPFTRSKRGAAAYEASVAAWLTDTRREITGWTDEAARLIGYSVEEAVGLHVGALYTVADQRNAIPELEMVASAGGVRTFKGIRVRRDSTCFKAITYLLPIRTGNGRTAGFVELVIPDPQLNGFAVVDPRRKLQNAVHGVRRELHALRIAAAAPELAEQPSSRARVLELVDALHDALEELSSTNALAGSEERGRDE